MLDSSDVIGRIQDRLYEPPEPKHYHDCMCAEGAEDKYCTCDEENPMPRENRERLLPYACEGHYIKWCPVCLSYYCVEHFPKIAHGHPMEYKGL